MVSSCALSSPITEGATFSKDEPVAQGVKPSPIWDTAPEPQDDASSLDESLCSFEINEIYTSYQELCEGSTEEEEEDSTGLDPESPQKTQIIPEDRTKVPLLPAKTQNRQVSFSEEDSSSDPEEELSTEDLSDGSESCLLSQTARCLSEAEARCLNGDKLYGKCVSDQKTCQNIMQRLSGAIERIKKPDTQDARREQPLAESQRQQHHDPSPLQEAYLKRTEEALRNIRGAYSGDKSLLWKAVSPPSRFYIPPPLQVSGTHRFQARENECKNENRSQDSTTGNNFGLDVADIPRDRGAAGPNYQVRWKTRPLPCNTHCMTHTDNCCGALWRILLSSEYRDGE